MTEAMEAGAGTLRARLARPAGAVLMRGPAGVLTVPEGPAAPPPAARGTVALCLRDPLALVGALIALDGAAEGIVPISPGQPPEAVRAIAAAAGADALVTDRADLAECGLPCLAPEDLRADEPAPARATRWLMTTSGTTGLPKIAAHDLASLARTARPVPGAAAPVWGLLYDPTRFAGLQVVLQGLLGGGEIVAPDLAAPLGGQVAALAAGGVTHLSATPTLWRRLLMVPGARDLPLRQVTLGGEIVDQPVLDALAATYPGARIVHIYASTEAGVGFSVADRRAGFPAAYLEAAPNGVRLALRDGTLWLRPPGPARRQGSGIEVDPEGFVRTGDGVEIRDDRAHFLGRESGAINVGGAKVHPETVERVILAVPGVALAQVSAKASPITGALVTARIALSPGAAEAEVLEAVRAACRAGLPREAMPARLSVVDGFETNAAGKLARPAAQASMRTR